MNKHVPYYREENQIEKQYSEKIKRSLISLTPFLLNSLSRSSLVSSFPGCVCVCVCVCVCIQLRWTIHLSDSMILLCCYQSTVLFFKWILKLYWFAFNLLTYLSTYLFLGVLGLPCCALAFFSWEWGGGSNSLVAALRLLIPVATIAVGSRAPYLWLVSTRVQVYYCGAWA